MKKTGLTRVEIEAYCLDMKHPWLKKHSLDTIRPNWRLCDHDGLVQKFINSGFIGYDEDKEEYFIKIEANK